MRRTLSMMFSICCLGPYDDTIIPKKKLPNGNPVEIGQRLRLSPGDITQANKLYKCTGKRNYDHHNSHLPVLPRI